MAGELFQNPIVAATGCNGFYRPAVKWQNLFMTLRHIQIKGCKFCFLILLSLFAFSCAKERQQLPKPLEDLIAATTNCTCTPFLDEYRWRFKTVYVWSCAGPTCNCVMLYYDKNGEQMTMPDGYGPDEFRANAKLVQHVWRCEP